MLSRARRPDPGSTLACVPVDEMGLQACVFRQQMQLVLGFALEGTPELWQFCRQRVAKAVSGGDVFRSLFH